MKEYYGDDNMSEEEEWKPNKELSEWAKNHFKEMNIGGVWMPEGSGLTYKKGDGKSWTLVQMVDSNESKDNHERMKVLMWDVGIGINDGDFKTLPQPQNDMEAHMMEVQMKRELAQSWADKDGTPLIELGLEDVYPEYIEDREILMENGDPTTIEIWAYKALNTNTNEYISIDPDDYRLLMGDEMFMRFRHKDCIYRALNRQEMVEAIDNVKPKGLGVGSKVIEGVPHSEEPRIPPWMWGTYCGMHYYDESFLDLNTLDALSEKEA